jgi:phosphoribulokinase
MTGPPGPGEIRTSFLRMLASRPTIFIIGVAGDSGTGKTTFTASLRHLLGDTLVSTLTLDDYHLLDREQRRERNITPLAPEANDLQKLEDDLRLLKSGSPVRKSVYNHEKGILEGPVDFSPTPILIVEGLHSIFTEGLRDLTDFSLYVDPDPDVKREWKLKRDTGKRGYTEREALEEMHRREKDYQWYIAPQKDFADAVIRISFSRQGRDLGWHENIYQTTLLSVPSEESEDSIGFFITIPPLFSLKTGTFSIEYGMKEMGARPMAALTLDGKFNRGFVSGLAGSLMADTGVDPLAIFGEESLTSPEIVQLLLCWRVLQDILQRRDHSG